MRRGRPSRACLAALDLGTNNCRLLIATPRGSGFRIVDAFSRIVRLGEGVSTSGRLSDAAMDRAIEALKVCAEKITYRRVTHQRLIATQACRSASNGDEFLERVKRETGLAFDLIDPQEEARLAVAGCSELLDQEASAALIFDIGGGSTELSWLKKNGDGRFEQAAWASIPLGVVNLSEEHNGRALSAEAYERAASQVRSALLDFGDPAGMRELFANGEAHLLGTSGTVTSLAGVHLDLARYSRREVDGLWLRADDVAAVTHRLREMSFEGRAENPSIGPDRADLVVCGCAILDALLREWPASRVRVADRGLREGILADLSRQARKERRRGKRRRKKTGKTPG